MKMKGLAGKRIYNQRYVQAIDAVKKAKGIRFDADICRALGLTSAQIVKLRQGTQIVQLDNITKLTEVYRVNPAFIVEGSGDMFLPPPSEAPDEQIRSRIVDIVENDLTAIEGKPVEKLFYDKESITVSAYRDYKHRRILTASKRLIAFLEKAYRVNRKYIETGEGEKFLPDKEDKESDKAGKPIAEEPPSKEFLPKAITITRENEDIMILVPQKVAAGYLGNIADHQWVETLPTISLPDMPRGKTTRAFEIEGDSMLPHFHEGAYVGCTFLENLDHIQEGYVYIVVTDEGVTMKRVYKRGNSLRLISDNSLYKPFEIPLKEVREIWKVHRAITAQFPPPSETDAKVNHLELEVVKLGKTVALIAQKVGV